MINPITISSSDLNLTPKHWLDRFIDKIDSYNKNSINYINIHNRQYLDQLAAKINQFILPDDQVRGFLFVEVKHPHNKRLKLETRTITVGRLGEITTENIGLIKKELKEKIEFAIDNLTAKYFYIDTMTFGEPSEEPKDSIEIKFSVAKSDQPKRKILQVLIGFLNFLLLKIKDLFYKKAAATTGTQKNPRCG